ncbi:MAG: phosphonate ABC transporter substrate-binding protein [Alphaproteobacteria bacterium]|nr:MAG: phosphonate ABC transporter substrate-binding protein [Alphaproteobacteria bacterium]
MQPALSRRAFTLTAAAAAILPAGPAGAETPIRFGLTPVFLDNDAEVIDLMHAALAEGMGRPVELVQRRTYEEVTALLLEGGVDAAWVCGYPYLQHRKALTLIGVPVWQGKPLYRSYLIVAPDDPARGLADLAGGTHAFSDPNSNSGWLVTTTDIIRMGRRPETFFARSIFTYGHRNVVRAVAAGLTRSGSVDGYVWEVLKLEEPGLAGRTRVVTRSEWLGFPPIVCRADRAGEEGIRSLHRVLLELPQTETGRRTLAALHLDAIADEPPSVFDGIAARMADLEAAG